MAPSASVEALPSIAAISPTAIGRSGPVATGTGGALTVRVTVSVVVALATPGVVGDGEGGGVERRGRRRRGSRSRRRARVPSPMSQRWLVIVAVDVVAGAAAQGDRLAGGGVVGLAGLGDGREVDRDLAGGGAEVAGVAALVLDPQHGAVEAGALVGVGGGGAFRLGAVGEGPVVAGERAVGGRRAAAVEGDRLAGGGGDGSPASATGAGRTWTGTLTRAPRATWSPAPRTSSSAS